VSERQGRQDIPFVDFRAALAPLRREIDEAIRRVLDSGWYILGPEGEAFERELAEFFGAGEAIGVGNGTEALQLAIEALQIGPDAEVVTSPLTAAFTALAILRAGARPVLADVDPVTLNISAESIRRVMTPRTKALMPVDLYGHPADLDPILALGREHGIPVIEDACQAHGALYKGRPVGHSCPAALSFYPTKNLGGLGDGGALLVNDAVMGTRVRQLRNGGQTDRYHHLLPGMNSRLDELQAAILRVKLRHLAASNARRRHLARVYLEELQGSGIVLPQEQPYAQAVYHLFVVRSATRDALLEHLRANGVGALIHYPIPLHLQPAFSQLRQPAGSLPVVERAAQEILSLPLAPELTEEQVRYVASAIRSFRAA
jgi:dTDP-4-amino-4,6-dideoxygalactose transaminase